VKQAAIADCLLVSKTDLAANEEVLRLRRHLARVNPGAQVHDIVRGEIAPSLLFGAALDDAAAPREQVERWLNEPAYVRAERPARNGRRAATASHIDRINAFAVRREAAVTAAGLAAWLNLLAALKGANLLRVKGLVNVEGRPVAVHAVQSVIHEPVELAAWPSADHGTRIVFITRDMARPELEATLLALELDGRRNGGGVAIDPEAYARFARAAAGFRAG
jgi:G3E family GTPase